MFRQNDANDAHDPFVVVDADEAMANAERDLKADAEWKRIQQNTFTRWANEHLKQADKQVITITSFVGYSWPSLFAIFLSAVLALFKINETIPKFGICGLFLAYSQFLIVFDIKSSFE